MSHCVCEIYNIILRAIMYTIFMKKTPQNTHAVVLNRIIFILSIIGVLMAIYVLQSFIRKTGIVCVTSGCELVRKNPASYLFGFFPVPAVGLIGYTVLTVLAFLRTTIKKAWVLTAMIGMATFGVGFVTWFTYIELAVIKGICTWCALSAVNMVIIFALLIKSRMLEKHSL
jgi:uncharacterized membrane protein